MPAWLQTSRPLHPAVVLVVLVTVFGGARALANERFVQKVTVQPGLVAVVAEGDLEARSIGSYSVRVYSDPTGTPENETTFYTAGLIRPRDGTLRSADTMTVAGRSAPLLVVVVQSAGSGGYLSADAFAIDRRSVRLAASVDGLSPNEDPVAQLKRRLSERKR